MKLFTFIFSSIGVLLLGIAGYIYFHHQKFMSTAKIGKGTVVRLEYSRSSSSSSSGGGVYYPVINYTTQDGKEYVIRSNSGSNPPAYEEGEKVDVYYNPNDPNDTSLPDFFNQWGAILIVGGIGLVFSAIGFGILFSQMNRKKAIGWLEIHGISVQANFEAVRLNTSLKINGKSPYVIWCNWLDTKTNTVYTFKSDNLWFDPSPYIHQEKIKVLIDPANPKKKNFVDTSFLPNQA